MSAPLPSASCILICTVSVTVCFAGSKLTTLAGNTKQKGELHSTGAISSDTDVKAAGISGKSHTHRGDSGGTTGTPQ
ncbi:hypothetical protein [Aggregatibacter actinomycetemcomitans]|uniref:hypothetical protein n=1 Tax=Aggregatibacter actinomycetemcomitans TaxID=714 RepID=UPI001E4E138C